MYNQLFAAIASIQPVSAALAAELPIYLKREQFPRKHLLLREGQVCNRLYFIEQGLARAYYYKDGEQVTSWIFAENNFIVSVYSFYSRKPSHETIELLEGTTAVSIHYNDLQKIYLRFPEFNYVGRVLTEQYYVKMEEQALSLRMLSAQERYEALLLAQPHIFRRAMLKHIASLLRMTPETLSRLRRSK